jgi:hypothetical protein
MWSRNVSGTSLGLVGDPKLIWVNASKPSRPPFANLYRCDLRRGCEGPGILCYYDSSMFKTQVGGKMAGGPHYQHSLNSAA